jgi:hypothetical protein
MTRSEAHQIVKLLKLGRSFNARFQEQAWELTYLGSGIFENCGTSIDDPPATAGAPVVPSFRESMTETELVDWLCRTYTFDGMMRCGR